MYGIVHDPHTNTRHSQPTYYVQWKKPSGACYQARIDEPDRNKEQQQHDNRFKYHTGIGLLTNVFFFKI
jgi:hypothetical protein